MNWHEMFALAGLEIYSIETQGVVGLRYFAPLVLFMV